MNQEIKALGVAALTALAAITAEAKIAIEAGERVFRDGLDSEPPISGFPMSASGITYAGGDTYYVVADDKRLFSSLTYTWKDLFVKPCEVGLYKVTMMFSEDGKSITDCICGPRIALSGALDIEAVAYDPGSGNVWAADESTKTIKEYDVTTGEIVSTLDIPPIMKGTRSNYGFESLTISCDGLTMWTANEESLFCDGPCSSYHESATNRIVKFTRKTIRDKWQLEAMYPYVTETWTINFNYNNTARRGISDMCALPDGSLLVLERECNLNLHGYIYRITPEAFGAATNVKDFSSLAHGGWEPLNKGGKWRYLWDEWGNFEGLCFGKVLSDDTCSLVTLTDNGESKAFTLLVPLVLSGLNVHTLSVNSPSPVGVPTFYGQNYRFAHNAVVTNELYGEEFEPRAYTNDGTLVFSSMWSLPAHGKTHVAGRRAVFNITKDDTLTWNVSHIPTIAISPIYAHDTFEEFDVGTFGSAIGAWSGNGFVVNGAPPSTHWLLRRAFHDKMLDAMCGVERSFSTAQLTTQENARMDLVIQAWRSEYSCNALPAPEGNPRLSIAADKNGKLCLWCKMGSASASWQTLSDTQYYDGAWMRVGVETCYRTSKCFARVFVDREPCQVNGGYSEPAVPPSSNSRGEWFQLRNSDYLTRLSLTGTHADDLVLAQTSFVQQLYPSASIMVSPTSGANGAAVAGGQAYTVATAVAAPTAASVAAASTQSSKTVVAPAITGFGFTPEKLPRIKFTGYVEGMTYRVLCSSSIDFANAKEIAGGVIDVKDDGKAVTALWEGAEPDDPAAGAKFYRVEAVAGAGEAEY